MLFDAKTPHGDLANKWSKHKFDLKLVNPANKKKYTIEASIILKFEKSENILERIIKIINDPTPIDKKKFLIKIARIYAS